MTRAQVVLAAMASAGISMRFTPVQVQKIFFLLDERASHALEGPHFNFTPYDYGPFDVGVYNELQTLTHLGLVETDTSGRYRSFSLTAAGFDNGRAALATLPAEIQEFIRATVLWVKSLRFDQLVAAIYREYPQMKVNSVFNK